jgi:hypothetical protein
VLDLYDRPLSRDWLTYLTALGLVAAVAEPQSRASVLDLVFALAVQFLLFGVIPGLIRQWVRNRRH